MFATKKKPEEATSAPAQPAGSSQPSTQAAVTAPTGVRKFPDEIRQAQSQASPSGAQAGSPGGLQPGGSLRGAPPRPARLQISSATSSVLNPHLFFEGNLKYTGSVTVDCELRGSISSDDTLIVGPSGKVNAEVTAGVIEISGKVHGNIRAKTRVKILTGGEVYGNIETPTISMDDGVVFEGNCSRPAGQPTGVKPQSSSASDVDRILAGAEAALHSVTR